MAIAELLLRKQMNAFDGGSREAFPEYLELRIRRSHLANARSMRNAIDRIRLRRANRPIRTGGSVPREEGARLDGSDVRRSGVFHGGPEKDGRTTLSLTGRSGD